MKRIGFNLVPYTSGLHGGAEVYLRAVIREFVQSTPDNVVLFGSRRTLESYRDFPGIEFVEVSGRWSGWRPTRLVGQQLAMPIKCRRYSIDCLVSNYVGVLGATCKQVVIVHDLLYRRFPAVIEPLKLLYWRLMIPLSLRRCAAVATVSEFSASEIQSLQCASDKPIYVTGEGVRSELLEDHVLASGFLSSRPYILSIATFGSHKNLETLVQAFLRLASDWPELSLLLVGGARTPDAVRYQARIRQLIERSHRARDQIQLLSHVSDADLASLYRNAEMLVIPSYYEGFGLPVVEAQSLGCPIIVANAGSLPEVAGAGALFFEPDSIEELAARMTSLLGNNLLVEALRTKGRNNVQRYSWRLAAAVLQAAVDDIWRDEHARLERVGP